MSSNVNSKIKVSEPNIANFITKILELEYIKKIEIIQNKQINVTWSNKKGYKNSIILFY